MFADCGNDGGLYSLALSFVKGADASLAGRLEDRGITPEEFFTMSTSGLTAALGMNGTGDLSGYNREEALAAARKELATMQAHGVSGCGLMDEGYPVGLSQLKDAPLYLYSRGECDFNTEHVVSIVGMRKPTPRGVEFTRRLVGELAVYFPDLIVVSGLAWGIDIAAHRAALEAGVRTVAFVAHGLYKIYPHDHVPDADAMVRNGGAVMSEYPYNGIIHRQQFLARNRLVAGVSAATVVVECGVRSGALHTANRAFESDRCLLAVPGRPGDEESEGCNLLIKQDKARLMTCAADLIEALDWHPGGGNVQPQQRNLFPELDGETKVIYDVLKQSGNPVTADVIQLRTGLPIMRVNSLLGDMEFDGLVTRHPGNRFSV